MDFIGTDDWALMAVYGLTLLAPWAAVAAGVVYLVRAVRRRPRDRA